MNKNELYKQIEDIMDSCFQELNKYQTHTKEADPAIKEQVEGLREMIKHMFPEESTSATTGVARKQSAEYDFDPEVLEARIYVFLHKFDALKTSLTPGFGDMAKVFFYSFIPGSVITPSPPPINEEVVARVQKLRDIQEELNKHIEEIKPLDAKPEVFPRTARLMDEAPQTDASRMMTMVAKPYVEEAMQQNFASMFEYAYCLEIIKDKLSGRLADYSVENFLDKVQAQILHELNITSQELHTLQADNNQYKIKESQYLDSRISAQDCLDIAHLYDSKERVCRNIERLFAKMDNFDAKNYALLTSFKSSFAACEANNRLMKFSLENVAFLRDQAKSITQKFDQRITMLPGGRIEHALALFGIPNFIRENFRAFSYKELSDLARVRISLETQPWREEIISNPQLPKFAFAQNLGDRQDFSYGMQKYQGYNLEKYALVCSQQMQLAHIILRHIDSNDPKFKAPVEKLRKAFEHLQEQKDPSQAGFYIYRTKRHRKLHEALNRLCNNFYPDIDQKAAQLLIEVGNIQRSIDYNIYANDLGNILVTNSAAHTYGEKHHDTGRVAGVVQDTKAKALGSVAWGDFSLVASVGRNATELFQGSVAKVNEQINSLNYFAHVLDRNFTKDTPFPVRQTARDKALFKSTGEQRARGYVARLLNFINWILASIGAVLMRAIPKQAQKLPLHKKRAASYLKTFIPRVLRQKARAARGVLDSYHESKLYRQKVARQVMLVQLEQQVKALEKSLQLAKAMGIPAIGKQVGEIGGPYFGAIQTNEQGKEFALRDQDKAYYKIMALHEAVKSIPDYELREHMLQKLEMNALKVDGMDLESREEYIKNATRVLAKHADQIKIDTYYNQCREQFEAKIGTIIDQSDLTIHGQSARATISWLLATPVILEATRSLFMLSPFVKKIMQNLRSNFFYYLSVGGKRVQDLLYHASIVKEKSKILEIPGSPKKAAEYFVYEFGKMKEDLKCADRIMEILATNPAVKTEPAQSVGLTEQVYNLINASLTIQHNPYSRAQPTFLAALQEQTAAQLVDTLRAALKFTQHLENKNELDDVITELKRCLQDLTGKEALANDIVRNKIILQTIPAIAKLTSAYQLQNDEKCFEFLMLLRFANESIGTCANFSIQVQEYLAYHQMIDVPKNDVGFIQKFLDEFNVGNFIYKEIVNIYSGAAVKNLDKALQELPRWLEYVKLRAKEPAQQRPSL